MNWTISKFRHEFRASESVTYQITFDEDSRYWMLCRDEIGEVPEIWRGLRSLEEAEKTAKAVQLLHAEQLEMING